MPPSFNRSNPVRGAVSVCAALIAALAVAPAAFAEDIQLDRPLAQSLAPTSDSITLDVPLQVRSVAPHAISFYETHLLPRMSKQLSRMAPVDLEVAQGLPFSDHLLFDEVTHQASRRMERAASRALQDFLLDTSVLGRLAQVEKRYRSKKGQSTSRGISFGVSHGLPEVELKYKRAMGTMRLGLAASGEIGVKVYRGPLGRQQMFAAYDVKEDRLTFLLRFGM